MDNAFIQQFVTHNYPLQPVKTKLLRTGGGRVLIRIEDSTGAPWVLRLHRQNESAPSWAGGGKAAAWLDRRAALLEWLAQRQYPAPALLRTRAQGRVSRYQNWCGILTRFVPGSRLDNSRESFTALAETIGTLHVASLQLNPARPQPAVHSWWHPLAHAAGYALRQLPGRADLPEAWQALHTTSEGVLRAVQRPLELPVVCIHGDCWTGNAIRSPGGQIILIDWDTAGLGAAILDFGSVLGDCYTLAAGEVVPDEERITTVVGAYRRCRPLAGAEVTFLPQAIQFGAAFRTALRFSHAVQNGWEDGVSRGLAREQERLKVSRRIARVTLAQLDR